MERIELARKIAKTSKLMFKVNAVISVLAAVFYVELMMRINGMKVPLSISLRQR